MTSWWLRGFLPSLIWVFLVGTGQAASLETLLMPGPLIEGHAKLEEDCSKCHDLFKKAGQNKKCLDCHKIVAKDFSAKKGFHGKSKKVQSEQCKFCHTDHIGRTVDIIKLDRDIFDHKVTDFPLKGKHRKVICSRCHLPKKKFREAPVKCFACHKKDDPHLKRLGTDCKKCHNESAWKQGKFDHDKTKFALKGKHKKVSCNSCHPNQRFKKTPMKCFSCHKSNDVHGGRLGKKCQTCHRTEGWKKFRFDHNRDTKFPLKDSHSKLRCEACHKSPRKGKNLKQIYKGKMDKKCWACHQADDTHKKRFGVQCNKCHASTKWKKVFFDHSKDTKFKLIGAHVKTECRLCHKENAYKVKLKKKCHYCHEKDDVHKGQQGKKCDKCHNSESWVKNVKFDHSLTKFPLIGLHTLTACENCHVTRVYKKVKTQCVECHLKSDVHKARLGPDCKDCHTPKGWPRWDFDHDKKTKFALKGSHKGLSCYSCHVKPAKKKEEVKLKSSCYSCHKSDDIHKGAEGTRCDDCHQVESWGKQVRFEHDMTRFPLIGMHAVTTCENCHESAAYKKVKNQCVDCHRNDDIHKERLSESCGRCHNPNGWQLWRFDHAKRTEFPLEGAHKDLGCLSCHTEPVKKRFRVSKTCIQCHRGDDVHRGRFGRDCGRCHTNVSFDKDIKLGR